MRTCEVPGCERKYKARGYCRAHYRRWERGVPVDGPIKTTFDSLTRKCAVKGCRHRYHAKGYCLLHYSRHKRGMPLVLPSEVRVKPLPVWARPASAHQKCACGKPAIAICTAGVAGPTVTTRKAPVQLVLCEECLQSERYVRGEIDFRELQQRRSA